MKEPRNLGGSLRKRTYYTLGTPNREKLAGILRALTRHVRRMNGPLLRVCIKLLPYPKIPTAFAASPAVWRYSLRWPLAPDARLFARGHSR